VTSYSEFEPKKIKALEQELVSVIAKPIEVNMLLDLAEIFRSKRLERSIS